MQSADYWIEKLKLEPHPEGGFFKETYRANLLIDEGALPADFQGHRFIATGIYFLLKQGHFSAFHKIKSDEMWHFYDGQSLEIVYIDASGDLITIKLGRDFDKGEVLQAVVPANCYFGSYLPKDSTYALVGCTVSPGFDFQDFEMPSKEEMLRLYPQFDRIISKLTH